MNTINFNSIKKTRVRVKDVKAGKTIYVAHPVYGIEKHVIASKPFMNRGIGLFAKYIRPSHFGGNIIDSFSLCDAGITEGDSYNGRRAFFKRKHAVAWMEKWGKDKNFNKHQERHEQQFRDDDDIFGIGWDWGDDWGWSGD